MSKNSLYTPKIIDPKADTGHREPNGGYGPFEAISHKPHSTKPDAGDVVRSRHWSRVKAEKRLAGVSNHTNKRVVDHTPPASRL